MKIQYIAVIFVIIILPISLVMSSYIQNQIDAITLQTAYDKSLITATYDAVLAFQLNTTNNKYSSISDSKIRDIEASVNTFYNSLNNSMAEYAQAAKDLESYIPAMLFTLYDGYYIYTSYDNVYERNVVKEDEKEVEKVEINLDGNNYQNGLKPYVYYSAKYNLNGNIIVVNYTLDNKITVYGDVGDGNGYTTKSGYLINPNEFGENIIDEEDEKELTYNGVTIKPEKLTEHLITLNEEGKAIEGDYNYVYYQNEKIYQNVNGDVDGTSGIEYFWYKNYMKTVVNDPDIKAYLETTKKYSVDGNTIMSTSAFDYYNEAKIFSKWVIDNLGEIKQSDTIKNEDGVTTIGDNTEYLSENTGDAHIFDTTQNGNDPLVSDSTFNNHRLAVIRKTIETNLNTVISNYHASTQYDYAMPVMSDDDWYKILNNVSLTTFMQGMTIGYRYYSNYAIITNNVNKEVVKTENIYIVTDDGNGNREYHQPGCKELLENIKNESVTIVGAYPTASFQRQSIRVSENSEDDIHFYYQARGVTTEDGIINKEILTGCYNCIVNATADYDVDDIISGNDLIDFVKKAENGGNGDVSYELSNSNAYKEVRTAYLTALARERYDLYEINYDVQNSIIDDEEPGNDEGTKIILNETYLLLKIGQTEQINASIIPSDDSIELVWKSDNESIATVNSDGKVTGISPGMTTITVETADNKSATCTVIVTEIAGINLDETTNLYVDETKQLVPRIEPSIVVNNLKWNSSDENIVKVDNDGNITGISPGEAEITVSATDGSNLSAECKVTVGYSYLADIVKAGDYIKYSANGYSEWRVMSVTGSGATGVVTLISGGNATTVAIGYMGTSDYITKLNNICKKYINSEYASSARCVGTNSSGGNNSSYNTEISKLKTIGLLITKSDYWIGYHRTNSGCSSFAEPDQYSYFVNSNGIVDDYNHSNKGIKALTKGVRPVINLKKGIYQIGGDGTKNNPYIIQN